VPLTTWCFGLPVPPALQWTGADGRPVTHWYSLRMEHIHTLPQPWTLEDEIRRVRAWQSLGVDDIIDVSVPWSMDPEVTWTEALQPGGAYPVRVRDYATPAGPLRHAVAQTGEEVGEGWVMQPDTVPLFEDFNIPRGVKHPVASPADVPAIRHLYAGPDADARAWFADRMAQVQPLAEEAGVPVQAWAAFGMDGVVWLTGTEGAILLALEEPDAFTALLDTVTAADAARVELAASTPGVDLVVERGWYSSTDFWSPRLFDQFLFAHIKTLAAIAHRHGKPFGYVMTTGVEILGPRLADAGVDVLYFADPVQDRLPLACARDLAARMTLVGGTNALSLASGDRPRICDEVKAALDTLAPTNRFILHPVDAVFPDTPWQGIEWLIEAWKEWR
jgi:sugar phosphate isomerase/epimerase